MNNNLHYMSGFGNEFATESLDGALPVGQNSPQQAPYGLYPEQITGSPFTAPRATNKRSWFYRIRPSVVQPPFTMMKKTNLRSTPFDEQQASPNQLRWDPIEIPTAETDLIDGLLTIAGNGDTHGWSGLGVHLYACNTSMAKSRRYFYNADGEMLFVLQQGGLTFRTEMGIIQAVPNEIVVIPRGIKFAVDVEGPSRGYICENYGQPFTIPDRGPIGANGMANERDFLTPVAAYEDEDGEFELVAKFAGKMWRTDMAYSPLNVVAWHGNYAPYKYDLTRFNVINTVSYDHPDPSIFTVLTSPSSPEGTANIDFALFSPRWMVAEHTFRPPYFHRNLMSEFMGMISGIYDGKEGEGFSPGGCSLHNCMSGHGPDATTFKRASTVKLQPHYLDSGLAFMFESRYIMCPTKAAMDNKALQKNYNDVWKDLPKQFTGKK
ncbi:MAG: homogentisate 1,2-dioxygenase [Micavibrio sp.]|nr:homogentisate 1,2-dioxygenase [Micavibrio sp.]|tara:strand:+ start:850 stop:2154 length:1305 start_codon:yes stop_codon:yes gene_type:complete